MNIPLRFFSFLLFSLSCFGFVQAQQERLVSGVPPENPELVEGIEAALKGDNEKAEAIFAKILQEKPGIRPPGIAAAMAFADPAFESKHFGKLRFWLEKTAEDFPDDPEAFLLLADLAFSERRYLECSMLARHALERVEKLSVSPERQPELRLHGEKLLVRVAERRLRWKEAEALSRRLIHLEPENAEHLYRLGVAQFRLGQKEEAVRSLTDAEAMDNRYLPALIVLAQLSQSVEDETAAKAFLAEALKKQGEDVRVLIAAADLELLWIELDAARQHAEKAHRLNPKSAEALMTLGILDLYDSDYPKAEEKFLSVMRSNPDHSGAMTGMALALCEQEDLPKLRRAFSLAKLNADRNPDSIDAQTTLAWVLVQADSLGDAEKILLRLFDAGDMNSPAAYYFAVVLQRQNRKDEAVRYLQAALERNVNFPKREAARKLLDELTGKTMEKTEEEPTETVPKEGTPEEP